MPRHDFGIMQTAPKTGKRYDRYEPQKYGCISVDDGVIMPLAEKLGSVRCYWHTLDRAAPGLAYYGITLIPPESLDPMIAIFSSDDDRLSALSALLLKAREENKFVIHFGI